MRGQPHGHGQTRRHSRRGEQQGLTLPGLPAGARAPARPTRPPGFGSTGRETQGRAGDDQSRRSLGTAGAPGPRPETQLPVRQPLRRRPPPRGHRDPQPHSCRTSVAKPSRATRAITGPSHRHTEPSDGRQTARQTRKPEPGPDPGVHATREALTARAPPRTQTCLRTTRPLFCHRNVRSPSTHKNRGVSEQESPASIRYHETIANTRSSKTQNRTPTT